MFDNLPDLIKEYPIGSKIRFSEKRDDYADGKFIVDGYLYSKTGYWSPAHMKWDGSWEIYEG